MSLVQWSKDLSVEIELIDKQHRTLIDMVNRLNDAMRQGKGKEALLKILDGLAAYTRTHFALEENYFAKYRYPDTEKHIRQHKAFELKIAEFRSEFMKGKLTLSMQVMNFLSDWLKNHILGTDQQYVPFLQEQGLK